MTQPLSERYQHIDFLRGFAALLVIYQHTVDFAMMAQPNVSLNGLESGIAHFFTKQLGLGEVGVCIFLMVSGFVVPFSLSSYPVRPVSTFVIHRFFRLYPAYWLSAILGLIFVWWRFGSQHGGNEINWLMFFANLTMFHAFFGIENIIGSYWTLTLELLFYITCIYLFTRNKLTSIKSISLFFFSLLILREVLRHVPYISGYHWNVYSCMRYTGYMFFGLLYREWLLNDDKAAGKNALIILALTYVSFAGKDIVRMWSLQAEYLKTPMTQFTAIAIFVLATTICKIRGKLGNFLGKISYSMYLFHPVIFYPLYTYFWIGLPPVIQAHPHLFFLLSASLTILFSYLSYRWIENPAINYGKQITRQRNARLSAPPHELLLAQAEHGQATT
ncbi:acyltransferase family protein [Undibacterium sp. JH2W]|uniref:acyltransferase family protein n=1 Tax=Undibacterium sp. JH2W TaxID=3413037 RepID=UPI003BF3CA9A